MDESGLPPPPAPSPTSPPGAPRPNNTKRVLIIIGVLLGLGLLFCLGAGIFAVWGFQKVGAGKIVASALDSQKGPGPDALRARGCTSAMALDLRDIVSDQDVNVDLDRIQVVCTLPPDNPLTCQEAAKVYADAANPSTNFGLVLTLDNGNERCTGLFGPAGEPADDLPAEPEPDGEPVEEPPADQLDMGGEEPEDESPPPANE